MENKKVILDTNLWISFLISHQLDYIDELLLSGKFSLIFSEELLDEFISVSKRPKLSKFFTNRNVKELLDLFDKYGQLCNVTSDVTICRDNKDNFLLNLAIDSAADYLLTGDNDLLVIKKIHSTKIMKWTDFLKEI